MSERTSVNVYIKALKDVVAQLASIAEVIEEEKIV